MKYITIDRVIFVVIIICLLFLAKCQADSKKIAESQVTELQLRNQTLDSSKNSLQQVVYTQTAIETASQESIKSLTDSIFKLKKSQERKVKDVIAYYSSISHTTIQGKKIPYLDTIKMKRFSDSVEQRCADVIKFYRDSSVEIPKEVRDSSQNFVFSGTVLKDTFLINKVSFPDSTYLRFVTHKNGLFKRNTVETQIFHTNPYVSVTSSNSVIYKPPVKRNLLIKALILAGGIYLGTKL